MEYINQNHEGIAWVCLWAWIALTIFIFAYKGSLPKKIYVINLLLLAAFVYLKILWK